MNRTPTPCDWCSGNDAEGEHENGCRLGLGPDELAEMRAELADEAAANALSDGRWT